MKTVFKTIYHPLSFKRPSGTSRGVLTDKDSWMMCAVEDRHLLGIGECSTIQGLSIDPSDQIAPCIDSSYRGSFSRTVFPAVAFGDEVMRLSMERDHWYQLYDTPVSNGKVGIPINGLIWMGTKEYMTKQIRAKIEEGFDCIKMKIGAINFEEELGLLKYIRSEFGPADIELRVDANGAFAPSDAMDKLKRLAEYQLHSIEQPIRQGQIEEMARLCDASPLDIALDEELIGVHDKTDRRRLLEVIKPQYIILKPSLVGGLAESDEWIDIASSMNIGWWATSALESNIGLNAIAQWISTKDTDMPQGLGTGGLYTNNIDSPMVIREGHLWYDQDASWDLSVLGL